MGDNFGIGKLGNFGIAFVEVRLKARIKHFRPLTLNF
jgi:hypothetical protein